MSKIKCSNCRHHRHLRSDVEVCNLKSPSFYDDVSSKVKWTIPHIVTCLKERQESKGFGWFRDKTRCGPTAINFEEK